MSTDNVEITAGTGTPIAADDIGGVKYQRVKITLGAEDAVDMDVDSGQQVMASSVPVVVASNQTAIPISDGGGSITVDGTLTTTGGHTEDSAHVSGDTGLLLLAVREAVNADLSAGGTDGDYEPLEVDATGRLWVHVGASDVGSTVDTDDGTVASAQASLALAITEEYRFDGTNWLRPVAHDAVDNAGSPYKIGARAETSPKGITLVADGDVTHLYADSDGIQLVKLNTSWGDLISERISNTDGASTAFSTFDNAAGTHNFITSVTVHNAHATTNGYVDFRDGTAGSVIWTFPLPATGGTTHNFNPPLRQPTAATALAYDVSAAITTIYISVNGFKSKI